MTLGVLWHMHVGQQQCPRWDPDGQLSYRTWLRELQAWINATEDTIACRRSCTMQRTQAGKSRAALRMSCRRRLPHTTQSLPSHTKLQKTRDGSPERNAVVLPLPLERQCESNNMSCDWIVLGTVGVVAVVVVILTCTVTVAVTINNNIRPTLRRASWFERFGYKESSPRYYQVS